MSSTKSYIDELVVALQAVHLASLLTKQHLLTYQSTKSQVSEETKADASEVTVADFAAQAILISIIHHAFPDDHFIAEESSEMLRGDDGLLGRVWTLVQSVSGLREKFGDVWGQRGDKAGPISEKLMESKEAMMDVINLGQLGGRDASSTNTSANSRRTWILDPIDGTKTYIRGQQYAICLCLVDEGEQRVAVLGCPNIDLEERSEDGRVVVEEEIVDFDPDGGWLLSAVKGNGAFLSRIRTPALRKPVVGVVGTGPEHSDPVGVTSRQQESDEGPSQSEIVLQFTDSSASPHISKDLHDQIFEHFAPDSKAQAKRLSKPAVPEGHPSLALDIWSMQMKYVLLTLRAAGADALIRTPPYSTYHAAVWDHAGGQLLLTESGGVLTDANGVVFLVDGTMRKLNENWGVCAVRGGKFKSGSGKEMEAREVHEVLLGKVKEEVQKRRKVREEIGEGD